MNNYLDERRKAFMSKVRKTESCWIWGGHLDKTGRGLFYIDGKRPMAHQASYLLFRGEIGGLLVCHKCDNPSCVNPDHLFLGTQKDNMRDCKEKGRNTFGSKHGSSKLSESDIVSLFYMNSVRYFEQKELGKHFGISASNVNLILNKKRWNHIRMEKTNA